MQEALLSAEIVCEHRINDAGAGDWLYLKLGDKVLPLGGNAVFADMLQFALRRNAQAFEDAGSALGFKSVIKSLQWGVAESEVLRDPRLPAAARRLLTELIELKL